MLNACLLKMLRSFYLVLGLSLVIGLITHTSWSFSSSVETFLISKMILYHFFLSKKDTYSLSITLCLVLEKMEEKLPQHEQRENITMPASNSGITMPASHKKFRNRAWENNNKHDLKSNENITMPASNSTVTNTNVIQERN